MKILITNDDGVHSQGIIQLAKHVRKHAEVFVVAPAVEQSGVSQAITYLAPLFPVALGGPRDTQDNHIPGYSLNGTPADCARLGLAELCPWKPDLVLSGINSGLNAGVNVCYSGTVGGALTAAIFGIPAIAISLESSPDMAFERVAELAWPLVERYYRTDLPPRTVININFPTSSLDQVEPEVVLVPVEMNPMGYHFHKGLDPKSREYFWATNEPPPEASNELTDAAALKQGLVTVSALSFDLNSPTALSHLMDRDNLDRVTG